MPSKQRYRDAVLAGRCGNCYSADADRLPVCSHCLQKMNEAAWKRGRCSPRKPKQSREERLQQHREYERKKRQENGAPLFRSRKHAEMFAEHSGLCDACGQPETRKGNHGSPKRLARDHNHETGQSRGLLCHGCNLAIGLAGDDPERLRKMADYLERYNAVE